MRPSQALLDCGGKRSATPLFVAGLRAHRNHQRSHSPEVRTKRFAPALSFRRIYFWTAVASTARHRFFVAAATRGTFWEATAQRFEPSASLFHQAAEEFMSIPKAVSRCACHRSPKKRATRFLTENHATNLSQRVVHGPTPRFSLL